MLCPAGGTGLLTSGTSWDLPSSAGKGKIASEQHLLASRAFPGVPGFGPWESRVTLPEFSAQKSQLSGSLSGKTFMKSCCLQFAIKLEKTSITPMLF